MREWTIKERIGFAEYPKNTDGLVEVPIRKYGERYQTWNGKKWVPIYFDTQV